MYTCAVDRKRGTNREPVSDHFEAINLQRIIVSQDERYGVGLPTVSEVNQRLAEDGAYGFQPIARNFVERVSHILTCFRFQGGS